VGVLNPLHRYHSVITLFHFRLWFLFPLCSNPYVKIDFEATAHSDRAWDRHETAWAAVLNAERRSVSPYLYLRVSRCSVC
jgi:hypothetical protein